MMSEEPVQVLKLFYCYAPEDEQWLEEIDLRLSNLKDQCHIVSWFDGKLLASAERKEWFRFQLESADLVLLLISSHFKAVEPFWTEISQEVEWLQWSGGGLVISLLLERVDWKDTPFDSKEALPDGGKP